MAKILTTALGLSVLILLGVAGYLYLENSDMNGLNNLNDNNQEPDYSIKITQALFCCGSDNPDLTLRIQNNGTKEVTITAIALGNALTVYEVRADFPIKIASGSSFEFSITVKSGDHVIDTNSDVLLTISYTGNTLQLTTEAFNFG